jgi:hypothetical protein
MRPCAREVSREESSLERRNTPYGPNTTKTNFPTRTTLDGVVVSWLLLWYGGPGGRDVQAGSTDRMVQQRHAGRFLVFPVCVVGLNLQDLRFIPTYFVPSSYVCWANFDFSSKPCVRLYLCSLMSTSKGLLVWINWAYTSVIAPIHGLCYIHIACNDINLKLIIIIGNMIT